MSRRSGFDERELRRIQAMFREFGSGEILYEIKRKQQEAIKLVKKEMVQEYRRLPISRTVRLDKLIKIGRFRFNKKRGLSWGAVGVVRGTVVWNGRDVKAWAASRRIENGYTDSTGEHPPQPFARPVIDRHQERVRQEIEDAIRAWVVRRR